MPEPRPGRDSDLMRSDLRSEGVTNEISTAYGAAQRRVCVCFFSDMQRLGSAAQARTAALGVAGLCLHALAVRVCR